MTFAHPYLLLLLLLPATAVARACAIKVAPRMKFTTGRP